MKFEFSAGGVVFKVSPVKSQNPPLSSPPMEGKHEVQERVEILVAQHSQHHGWVFPKGFIGDKEEFKGQTKEETALREVEEETGVIGKILEPLTPVTYWYAMDGTKRRKTVYYYIMADMGGDITKHDWEMENVEWLAIDKVIDKLTYDSDKEVWIEAKKRIEELVKS